MELPPIRCYSCGKVLANKYDKYLDYLRQGYSHEETYRLLGLNRYCCRRGISHPHIYAEGINIKNHGAIELRANGIITPEQFLGGAPKDEVEDVTKKFSTLTSNVGYGPQVQNLDSQKKITRVYYAY